MEALVGFGRLLKIQGITKIGRLLSFVYCSRVILIMRYNMDISIKQLAIDAIPGSILIGLFIEFLIILFKYIYIVIIKKQEIENISYKDKLDYELTNFIPEIIRGLALGLAFGATIDMMKFMIKINS